MTILSEQSRSVPRGGATIHLTSIVLGVKSIVLGVKSIVLGVKSIVLGV